VVGLILGMMLSSAFKHTMLTGKQVSPGQRHAGFHSPAFI
jgi:hypothetical protein